MLTNLAIINQANTVHFHLFLGETAISAYFSAFLIPTFPWFTMVSSPHIWGMTLRPKSARFALKGFTFLAHQLPDLHRRCRRALGFREPMRCFCVSENKRIHRPMFWHFEEGSHVKLFETYPPKVKNVCAMFVQFWDIWHIDLDREKATYTIPPTLKCREKMRNSQKHWLRRRS